jgi:hypothetical protein
MESIPSNAKRGIGRLEVFVLLIFAIVLSCVGLSAIFSPRFDGMFENASVAKAHYLAIASFAYENDNNLTCPTGTTSTAIFQQLYDGHYLKEPADVFLTSYGGKSIAVADPLFTGNPKVRLASKNVSFDYVTRNVSGLKAQEDPADLPLLYSCVATEPTWTAGANEVTLDAQCPWENEGVTLVTLGQGCRFVRPDPSGKILLTNKLFSPAKGVTYVSKRP